MTMKEWHEELSKLSTERLAELHSALETLDESIIGEKYLRPTGGNSLLYEISLIQYKRLQEETE